MFTDKQNALLSTYFCGTNFFRHFPSMKILWNKDLLPNQYDDVLWHKASILKRICQENYPREGLQCSNCNVIYYDEIERHLKVRAG